MEKNETTENKEIQNKTVSDSEVIKIAIKMMDKFDEAFMELAK